MKSSIAVLVGSALAMAAGAALAGAGEDKAIDFQGSRTRADVYAEAVEYAATHSAVPAAGSQVQPPLQSNLDPESVRREAVEATKNGATPRGEVG